jgi:acetylornithine/N-succinyldiaminopimelate aminotransferase
MTLSGRTGLGSECVFRYPAAQAAVSVSKPPQWVVHVSPDEYLCPLAGRLQPWRWQLADRYRRQGLSRRLVGDCREHPGAQPSRLVAAIAAQAGRLLHSSNLYRIPQQEQLADKLAALSGMDEVFFCNSGCEANEAAIKLARLYGHQQGVDSPATIVMEKAFHGRTMATLSATGNRKAQAGFEPLVSGFRARSLQRSRSDQNDCQVQQEHRRGDARNRAGRGWHQYRGHRFSARSACAVRRSRLAADLRRGAVRHGSHRSWFAFQHAGIRPDVVTLAKGLGGGVPIGACLVAGQAKGLFKPGNHGSTFGGNQLATTAALTTIEVIENDRLIDNALIVVGV